MREYNGLGANSRLKLLLSIIVVILTITGCSGISNSASSGSSALEAAGSSITIDNAGIVPVLGNSPTTTVIYVHNNSNTEIRGIIYSSESFISEISAKGCSVIPAKQSCPLQFTTPNIPSREVQGSKLITATYATQSGARGIFNQIITYRKVDNLVQHGALLNSGVQISGFNNRDGYATLYLFGSGNNQVYKINSITINNLGVKIVQGDMTDRQLQSNYVQAVEVMAPMVKRIFTAKLTVHSQNSLLQYQSNAVVNVEPSIDGAILTSGEVPLIDTSVKSPEGKLFIVNAGNESANNISITPPTGITIESGESDACGVSLASYGSCTIYFTISQGSSGSDDISVSYNGGSLKHTVTWYNSKDGPLLQMIADPNPMVLLTDGSASTVVTVTNVGGYNLESVTILAPVLISGSATTSIESDTCTGATLLVNNSCTYKVLVDDNVEESGFINLGVEGYYSVGSVSKYSRLLFWAIYRRLLLLY